MEKCIYCGLTSNFNKEHIIPNGLGGCLIDSEICCENCNRYLGKIIDEPFQKQFTPIIAHIENFRQDRKKNNKKRTLIGIGIFRGKCVEFKTKGKGNILSIKDLDKEEYFNLDNYDKNNLEDQINKVGYCFNIDNHIFKQGLCKIAFEFAVHKGIDINIMKNNLEIKLDEQKNLSKIFYNYPIIPFYPIDPIDKILEGFCEIEYFNFQLYHNIILFSENKSLWCYINLFNTFQFYVLLSENYTGEQILENYQQVIQKELIPEIKVYDIKDVYIYKMQYGIDIDIKNRNIKEIEKEIKNKIENKSLQKEKLKDIIDIDSICFNLMLEIDRNQRSIELIKSFNYYFTKIDSDNYDINYNYFKIKTLYNGKLYSYPSFINYLISTKQINIKDYTIKKFMFLNEYLKI